MPSTAPSETPSVVPSLEPTRSAVPSSEPTSVPSLEPSSEPSYQPSAEPSVTPSRQPSSPPSSAPSFDPETVRPLNDRCESADEIFVDEIAVDWTTANATVGRQCNQMLERGPSVWFRFIGTGSRIFVSACDFSSQFASGFNLYFSPGGTCETMTCIVPRTSSPGTCGDQASASVSFRSSVGSVYYVEVASFSLQPGFDQNFAGTTGFVSIRTD
jgi:hypothetical protein